MGKLILMLSFVLLILCFSNNVQAQSVPCETCPNVAWTSRISNVTILDNIILKIEYKTRDCNGISEILIDKISIINGGTNPGLSVEEFFARAIHKLIWNNPMGFPDLTPQGNRWRIITRSCWKYLPDNELKVLVPCIVERCCVTTIHVFYSQVCLSKTYTLDSQQNYPDECPDDSHQVGSGQIKECYNVCFPFVDPQKWFNEK